MQLLDLPNELLIEIISWASRSKESERELLHRQYNKLRYDLNSLRALRFICKQLDEIATGLLFEHLRIICDGKRWSLARLKKVTAHDHEHLARQVRRLDVGLQARPPPVVENEYVEWMRDNLCRVLERLTSLHTLTVIIQSKNPERGTDFARIVAAALQTVQLPNVTELELHLAYQGDFEHFTTGQSAAVLIPITDICSRLKHLSLGVEHESSLSTGPYNDAPSNVTRPIVLGAGHLRTLAQASPHLESLSIDVQNILAIDGWEFSPRLATLWLRRVKASPVTLSSLFSRTGGLRYIDLRRVRLKYGRWSQVLEALHASSGSCLVELYMRKCRHPRLDTGPDVEAERKKRREDAIAVFNILQGALSENRCKLRLPAVTRAENFIEDAFRID